MSWEDIPLKQNLSNKSNGGMDKNTFSIVWHPEKNSVSLTLNRHLNEPIEKGEYFYFAMKREVESGLLVILLQKKVTSSNIKMYVSTKRHTAYNYKINARAVVAQIMEALGIEKEPGIYHIKISDNKSKNNQCMLFETEYKCPSTEEDPYSDLTK